MDLKSVNGGEHADFSDQNRRNPQTKKCNDFGEFCAREHGKSGPSSAKTR